MSVVRLRAAWVFPVDCPPISNGIVEIVDGLLTDIRAARPHESADDLGDVAILPGLVNAHAHLEFSLVERPFSPASPFADWIRALVEYRRSTFGNDPQAKAAALLSGWREVARTGTTLLGEIATDGWSVESLTGLGPRLIAFREVIGLRPETISRQAAVAEKWMAADSGQWSDGGGKWADGRDGIALSLPSAICHLPALSPHAPYTVAPELLRKCVELAKQNDVPLAMHVAETREELELLSHGRGPLVEMLRAFGAWPDQGCSIGRRPLGVLRQLADAPRALVVHGNYLSDEEVEFLTAHPQLAVVYCARTHAFFGHDPHPWRTLLAKGARVTLGTDGRGSNPDLSMWNELVFLRRQHPDVSPSTLLELGTLAGARALGRDHECGTLTPGKRADLAVVSWPTTATKADSHELLFSSEQCVVGVFVGGVKL